MRTAALLAMFGLLIAAVMAAPASAAIQIGATFPPTEHGSANFTYLQTATPTGEYRIPSDGVIASWSHESTAAAQQLKLKVARAAGGNNFTIVGESTLETMAPSTLNTFQARIPVRAGDVIGLYEVTEADIARQILSPGFEYHILSGDPAPGTTAGYTMGTTIQFDLSATLEPDADNDGFGDETQDACPGQPGATNGCPPQTTITGGPKDKTRKKTATFAFTANVAGATFECSLDGDPFSACTSPHGVKVKKGKHSFEVRATDNGGFLGSPASDDWKVKKKRKRKK